MANAFNRGDVVVLKSGGPPMTISSIPGEISPNTYKCVWFKGATAASGNYPEHTLMAFVPPGKAKA